MPLQPATASSPIDVSSDLRSPHAITISSDSSPCVSDPYRFHQTSYVTDRSISLWSPGFDPRLSSPVVNSHASDSFPARVSHPANPPHSIITSHSAAASRSVTTSRPANATHSVVSATRYHDYDDWLPTIPALQNPPLASLSTSPYPLHPSESFFPSPKPHQLHHSTPLLCSLCLTRGLVVSAHPPCALASNSATSSPLPSTLLRSLCSHPEPYPGPSHWGQRGYYPGSKF